MFKTTNIELKFICFGHLDFGNLKLFRISIFGFRIYSGVANWGESQGDFGEDYPEFTWQVETTSTEVEGLERIAVIVQRSGGVVGREVRIEELMLAEQ
jgi:hypothetical protein